MRFRDGRAALPVAAGLLDAKTRSWTIPPAATSRICVTGTDDAAKLSFVAASKFLVEVEREEDGRWIAEVIALPGVLAYGASREEALAKAEVLALRVLADRIEHGEEVPEVTSLFEAA